MENIIFDFHDSNYESWERFIESSNYRENPKKEERTIRYSNHLYSDNVLVPESKKTSAEVLE